MGKIKEQLLAERKEANRTFKEETSLGIIQDKLTELESRIEALEK